MRGFLQSLSVLLVLGLAGCASDGSSDQANPRSSASAPSPASTESQVVGPPEGNPALIRKGDSLTVQLQGIPDPVVIPAQVDDTGAINLRFIGSIRASGLTPSNLAKAIQQAYMQGRFYTSIEVSVALAERYIYVGGEVNRPGRVIWTPDLTLSGAIAAAGGTSPYARENGVLLSRDNATHTLDARSRIPGNHGSLPLIPGDRLTVPRSNF